MKTDVYGIQNFIFFITNNLNKCTNRTNRYTNSFITIYVMQYKVLPRAYEKDE